MKKCQKEPTCGIFLKWGLFKDIKKIIFMCQMHKYKIKCQKDSSYGIFLKRRLFKDIFWMSHNCTRSSFWLKLVVVLYLTPEIETGIWTEESWLLTGERASEVIRLSGGDFSGHEPCYATAPPPFSSSHCSLTHVWRTKIEVVALGCVSLSPKKTSLFHIASALLWFWGDNWWDCLLIDCIWNHCTMRKL